MDMRGCGKRLLRVAVAPVALACVLAGLAAAAASASAVCQGWSGAQPPAGTVFAGVAVLSACDLWTAGAGLDNAGNEFGVVGHWTGGSNWAVPVHAPAGTELDGVAADSPTSVWAVGQSNAQPLIEHWDGSTWTSSAGADLGAGASGQLFSVSAASAASAWAVGEGSSGPLIEHWNGTNWALDRIPDLGQGATAVSLFSVSAVSATSAWAVGEADTGSGFEPLILHGDGTNWTPASIPALAQGTSGHLFSVSAVSAASAWAVGETETSDGAFHPLIERWDGHIWTAGSGADLGAGNHGTLSSVAAMSPGDVWISGQRFGQTNSVIVEHWDGSGWSLADGTGSGVPFPRALGAGPDGTVWAVGGDISVDNEPVAGPLTGVGLAEVAVNLLGRNLREAGLVNGPAGNLSVAAGTSPAVAAAPGGGFMTAWTAANNHLWTVDDGGHRTDTMQLVAAGTSPSIAALANGGYEIAYTGSDGQLRQMASGGTPAQPGIVTIVAAGTSPAIAAAPGGGFQLAVHQAGTDHLITITPSGAQHDTGLALAAGTSPAITALPGGGYQLAGHQASTDHLVTVAADGTSHDTGLAMAASTSPAITAIPGGGYQLAYPNPGNDLATLTNGATTPVDTGLPLTAGTSPAISDNVPPVTVAVPDVVSLDQGEAVDAITAAGLRVGRITQAINNRCIKLPGTVLNQDPPGGAEVEIGTPVNLTVCAPGQ